MNANRFDNLLRALTDVSSRRTVTRYLAGITVAGTLGSRLGLAEVDAKGRKKKKRRRRKKRRKENQPFCAGKNYCTDDSGDALCDATGTCLCMVNAESGKSFCGIGQRTVTSCAECSAVETCYDQSACAAPVGCALPCSDPFEPFEPF
jgi:hypothetical protein